MSNFYHSLKDLFSLKDYWYAIVSAGIGAWLAIRWTKYQNKKENQQSNERIKMEIVVSLKFNLDRAIQARDQMERGGMPNYPFDTIKLSSLLLQAYGVLDSELVRDIDWHRYQLDHITEKLSVINTTKLVSHVLDVGNVNNSYTAWDKMLSDSLREHYDIVVQDTPQLIERIQKDEIEPSKGVFSFLSFTPKP